MKSFLEFLEMYWPTPPKLTKEPLPKGKLSIRFKQMRGVAQAYVGGKYLPLADGENDDEVIARIKMYYDIPKGTKITSHASSKKMTYTL